jgi:tetratricopeptide (TPR) repeat protein
VQGHWDGDFGRARNAALGLTRATWALVVDADETLHADAGTLRAYLDGRLGTPPATTLDTLTVDVVNTTADGVTEHDSLTSVRIFRRGTVHYAGRVHELPVRIDGGPVRGVDVPRSLVHLRHAGYASADAVRAKCERNLAIAQAALDAMVADGTRDEEQAARVILDLGRSLMGLGRRQEAVDAFETLREMTAATRAGDPGGLPAYRAQATALLAQVLLDEGGLDEAVLVLEADLRALGTDPRYCAWLRAQALGRLGHKDEALVLLRGVDALVDPVGNRLALGPVLLARTLLAVAQGRFDEAGEALADAVARHGASLDQVPMLLELWSGREDELGRRLSVVPMPVARRDELAARLAGAGTGGEAAARLVTGPARELAPSDR